MQESSNIRITEMNDERTYEWLDEVMNSVRTMSLVITAQDLHLFDLLDTEKGTDELATKLGLDPVMARMMCEALSHIGLITPINSGYIDTDYARKYLSSKSIERMDSSLDMYRRGLRNWGRLGELIRDGPEIIKPEHFFTERWIRSMAERNRRSAFDLAEILDKKIDFSKFNRMLDLGGGHGMYAIAFHSRNPLMEVTVFDRPEMTKVAEEYSSVHRSQIRTMSGDFFQDDIGHGYDLVFSSFNASGSDPLMIPKVKDSLIDGGLFVNRQFRDSVKSDPVMNLEWNFFIFDGREKGGKRFSPPNALSIDEHSQLLESSGFSMRERFVADELSEIVIFQKDGQ